MSAPAGFGKTTLLAEWLGGMEEDRRRIAWVSLDAADSDPASFWTYVVSALQTAVPGLGPSALELIAPSDVSTESVLTMVLNDLATAPADVWLVLDDYHLVDSHEVANGMVFLLDHLPSHVHVMISTRADPELPLPRWRVRGELIELRAAELRFTSEEAAAYVNDVAGLDLSAVDVETLEQRTERWVAALQLAARSLQGRQPSSRTTPPGSNSNTSTDSPSSRSHRDARSHEDRRRTGQGHPRHRPTPCTKLNITNANAHNKYGDHSIPLAAGRGNYLMVVDDNLNEATTPEPDD